MSVNDAPQRERALDPARSFCVSAPAGSGKTELLIQRYLALLPRVERPEQVLAITFTRKAAAEMRERVLAALQAAAAAEPVTGPHQQRTRDLALAALAWERRQQWQLLRDIARFNIRTIDGFCNTLTRQMPILGRFGGQAAAVDDAGELYLEAVAGLFAQLDDNRPVAADLRALLLHFDNDWKRLQGLLVAMLARREQWQDYIGLRHEPGYAEQLLTATVETMVGDALAALRTALAPWAEELLALQAFAAAQLGRESPSALPGADPAELPRWRELRQLLLKQDGQWRQKVDVRQGFPAGRGPQQDWKARMQALLAELAGQESLREALLDLEVLPAPASGDQGWRLLLHLFHVLPVLAAQLLLVFQRRGEVDHTQIALHALQALGEDDAPTDLALRLDYRIEHLLVDEFQDTAINQFRLLQRLTRGWGDHNQLNPRQPRSFLIVGDGMQSIYGFRDANVSLFLRAREEGFNGVLPEHLELNCNFRSQAGIVAWVNRHFRQAFPARDNSVRGEIAFAPAVATRDASADAAVAVDVFTGANSRHREAAFIGDEVATALAQRQTGSIAILARSRGQLQPILAALRSRGVNYNAQDIDALATTAVVADLFSLCRALANPADRIAWLAVLRAPWCGLLLADLLRVARWGTAGQGGSVAAALQHPGLLAALSEDGRLRAGHVATALQQAQRNRDRLALRVWVEQLWLQLGGPDCAVDETGLHNAEQFLQLLEQADSEGRGLDIPWLRRRLASLYAHSGDPAARVQVMTLHRAKGLEFDLVILPALAAATRPDERPVLLWDDYTDARGERRFLLATDDHSQPGTPGLYNTLQRVRKRKSRAENARLLYVGATRAVQRLQLTACLAQDTASGELRPPSANALLHPLWQPLAAQAVVHAGEEPQAGQDSPAQNPALLLRLASLPK
ncbi:UvrD-helicase domain-containing protein [Kineobactrum salinum]|uniref:DNA 3'-5' helicase n=1 Tax=Kineobactrum salinum TaxID=2708301 RepID=A0A6C0U8P0_9GAMM|nr:UvrD-helicase domain-containing protein [Kineobactrum salinum]QIB67437.1 UvrD-helicase domain-containing protein [Kineobactrum salinum]